MTFAVRTQMDAGGGGPSAWAPVTDRYPNVGTFTETIPGSVATGGPVQLVVEVGGAGGGGAFSPLLQSPQPEIGGSGGSGGLCRTAFALTPADWGKTFSVSIFAGGAGGASSFQSGLNGGTCTVANGSFTRVAMNMQAGGGFGGFAARGTAGGGGVASGGNQANLSGNAGQNGGPQGGAGIRGNLITTGAGGGASIVVGGNGGPGLTGAAAFAYT